MRIQKCILKCSAAFENMIITRDYFSITSKTLTVGFTTSDLISIASLSFSSNTDGHSLLWCTFTHVVPLRKIKKMTR